MNSHLMVGATLKKKEFKTRVQVIASTPELILVDWGRILLIYKISKGSLPSIIS